MHILVVYHFSQHIPYETRKENVEGFINHDPLLWHRVTVVDNLQEAVVLLVNGASFDVLLAYVDDYPTDQDLELMLTLAGQVKHVGIMTDACDHWRRKLQFPHSAPVKRIAFVPFLGGRNPITGGFRIEWSHFYSRTLSA